MKFLVSVPKEKVTDDKWTTEREPVVPCFPSQSTGSFLTVPGFKMSDKATVADIDIDPDAMADALYKEYPGIPRKLHENYIMAVFRFSFDRKVGETFRIAISQKQATLIEDRSNTTEILWNEQPMK